MGWGGFFSALIVTIVSLAVVLGLAWIVILMLKKIQERSFGEAPGAEGDRPLRFIRALPLGPRERVALIEAEGERLLVGVSAASVTLIARWPAGQDAG
ncbi:MAG: FliO/MopB family protein [Sphingomonas sp.]